MMELDCFDVVVGWMGLISGVGGMLFGRSCRGVGWLGGVEVDGSDSVSLGAGWLFGMGWSVVGLMVRSF